MTGRVWGRTPRHNRNDSAACSTSMPSPSERRFTPWSLAKDRKGVRPQPYTIS